MITSGIDLVEIGRIERTIARQGQRFLDRIFTAQEQAYCEGRVHQLAARFAVKEAVSKALGTGIGDMRWVDIEVINNERGKPILHLHGKAQQIANEQALHNWSISISHTDTLAIGQAVALRASGK
ncbi:MAG: holo-ACP synthase [Candidatus Promineifilaceae bacterium]